MKRDVQFVEKEMISLLKNDKLDSLLLTSGDRGLYTRNHFGDTYQYTIHQSKIDENHYGGLLRKGEAADIFQIGKLRKEDNVRFESSLWEWSTLLESSGYTSTFKIMQTVFVAEEHGVIQGYVVIGLPSEKSRKQEAIVTEWGGELKAVHSILANLLFEGLTTEITMTIPWHEKYHEEFSAYPVKQLQQDGTIYLVEAERFIDQIQPYINEKDSKLATKIRVAQKGIDKFQLFYGHSDLTLTRKELTEVLFSVQSRLRPTELEKLFPIPLPYVEGMYYV